MGEGYHIISGETKRAGIKRDSITATMWEDHIIRHRGGG